jgi:Zn-dependent protease with chaperone function
MFGNFLYLIVVLLIYSTYQPPESTPVPAGEAVMTAGVLAAGFAAWVRRDFNRLARVAGTLDPARADIRFSALTTRFSILAVVLFAVDVYVLDLPAGLKTWPAPQAAPTPGALVFLLLFFVHLILIWVLNHDAYEKIYAAGVSRRSRVAAQIAFAAPVLLPWLVLSGTTDLIALLPFETPRRLLAHPAGELAYFLCFLVLVAIAGPALIRRFWRCRPLEDGWMRRRIDALCRRARLRYAQILYWPMFGGRTITAGVMGLVGRFRYILITPGLLRTLSPEQIDQVIAHEIGHVKRWHLAFYLLFLTGYILLAYALFDVAAMLLLQAAPVHRLVRYVAIDPVSTGSALLGLMTVTVFLVYFRLVFGYFMRNFERQADLYVYRLFPSARPLITTLARIALVSGIAPTKPDWHHFSIGERIAYLERCEADPRWIARHDRKVARSITVYLVAMAAVAVLGWQINFGEPGRRLSAHFLETAATRELVRDPHQPDLLTLLADIYQSRDRLAEAAAAYERAIALDPRQARALNNLAWLYATSDDPALRRPERALTLARRAADLDPAPHVLDTLAESYYVNSRFAEATAAGRRALEAAAPGDRAYFEAQLAKFGKKESEKGGQKKNK